MKTKFALCVPIALLAACAAPEPQEATSASFRPLATSTQDCLPDHENACIEQAAFRNPAPATGNKSGNTMFRAITRLF